MKTLQTTVSWVDFQGYPVKVGGDITAQDHGRMLRQIQYGEVVGDISELIFRDSHCLRPESYIMILNIGDTSHRVVLYRNKQADNLGGIRDKVSIEPYFRHSKGCFKGDSYGSEPPPMKVFSILFNNIHIHAQLY